MRRSLLVVFLVLLPATLLIYFYLRPNTIAGRLMLLVDERQQETRPLKLAEAGEWHNLGGGLDWRKLMFRREGRGLSGFQLIALRIDPSKLRLRMVVVEPEELPARDMETVATATGALALMNASYFEPEYKPMGLLIAAGQQLSPIRKEGNLHHGIFAVRGSQAFLFNRANADLTDVTEAFQAGPWLVTEGQPQGHFRNPETVTRRSAVGIDRQGRVVLAATDALFGGLSLVELAYYLAAPEPDGLGLYRAINCDGGTSTQLLLAHPKVRLTIRSTLHVPVYLGVFPLGG